MKQEEWSSLSATVDYNKAHLLYRWGIGDGEKWQPQQKHLTLVKKQLT